MIDDPIGAFVTHCDVQLPGSPGGPLSGLTLAVKDIFDIAGFPTGWGNPDRLRVAQPATATAPCVAALLDAGASIVGKTLTDEIAFSMNGENFHYGTPVNVNAPGRIPGGSSNGSAAAVAAKLVDIALGSDTGGSVRVPASYCGIYGIRPTHGRIPLDGIMPLAPSFDTVGWFARDPALMGAVGRVLLDWQPAPPPNRVLVPEDLWALAAEPAQAALRPLIERVGAAVGSVEHITLADAGGLDAWFEAYVTEQLWEIWRSHGEWIGRVKPTFAPGIADRLQRASTVTEAAAATARTERRRIAARLDDLLSGGAVVVAPIAYSAAPLRGQSQEALERFRTRGLRLTCVAALGELPQMSLPLAEVEGCPFALSLMAARGCDEMLLDLAVRLGEAVSPVRAA